YKAVPHIYHRSPSGDDIYSLFRINAVRYRCDLSCAIDLDQRGEVSQRRRRGVRKALKSGIEIVEGPELMAAFWEVLTDNLARKYQLQPVHSVNEISLLHSRFPDQIEFVAARLESEIVAGVVLFNSPRVVHAQYTASSQAGYDSCALDAVFEYCIEKAKLRGARYFDFGNSNEDEGRSLNSGLYRFKTEFGAGGVVHEFYEINLKS
ncbi:MAG TPA: GNAT family N-acetyltransferase, partial [Pyrinomonadaceae bacterium]